MKSLNLSINLKNLASKIYNTILNSQTASLSYLQQIYNEPKQILQLCIFILIKSELITKDCSGNYKTTSKKVFPALVPTLLRQTEKRLPASVYDDFITVCKTEEFFEPLDPLKTTFKELSFNEYINNKEFYDFSSCSIFNSNGTKNPYFLNQYFYRQFANHISYSNAELKTHIFVAENNNKMIGFVTISNYGACNGINHNLPCKSSEIYNVSFISVHHAMHGKGIASELLKYSVQNLINTENVFAINYLPINKTSEHIMQKVFTSLGYYIKERDYSKSDIFTFGNLSQYIIFPEQQQNLNEI